MSLRSSRPLITALGVIGALGVISDQAVHAAPCCMSATAFGIGRLLTWEDFAVGFRTSLSPVLGTWNSDGYWNEYGDYSDLEWRSEVWALVPIDRRLSLFLRLPAVVNARSTASDSDVGGGLGEVSFGGRYEILAIGEYAELPAIALTLAVLAPTGRATEDARTPLGVDVTGRGAWVLSAGLSVELTEVPWFVRLDLGTSVPLPAERADLGVDQRLGPSLELGLSGGIEVADNVVTSLATRLTWESETHLDEAAVADSDRLDVGLGLALSWRFAWHWTLQLGVDSGLFVDDLGKNQPGRVTSTLGLRYGSF